MKKLKTTNVEAVAKELSLNRKKVILYREGNEQEKVWDNYQLTKKLKREFVSLCSKQGINKSKFLRSCITRLIEVNGDIGKVIRELVEKDG